MSLDVLLADVARQRDLNEVEARALVDGMRRDVADLGERIATAYLGRAWIALGHASWDALCEAEFDGARLRIPREQRVEQVQSLRSAGLSTRAIGSALGVDDKTVRNDLAGAEKSAPVVGQDGKSYAPSQPTRPEPSPAPTPTAGSTTDPVAPDQPSTPAPAQPGAGEPTSPTEFLAQRGAGDVLSVEDWQRQTAALDDSLEQQLAGTDDRFLLNLARGLAACNALLGLSPQRAAETCTPGSDDHAALSGFIKRMEAWLVAVQASSASNRTLRRVK